MDRRIDPREIYLLERYSSLDYFGEMRDTWADMVLHVETCLQQFMQNIPPRYRSRPLPEQPDIVWGERVIPNFRSTLQGLNDGFILLSHGDVSGLQYAAGPRSDFKGQMDYWSGWMSPDDEARYHHLLNRAVWLANKIVLTEGAYWTPPLPISLFGDNQDAVEEPEIWPSYIVNRQVSVASGDRTKKSGVYVPDIDNSCPQFLSNAREKAPLASVSAGFEDVFHPITGEKVGKNEIFKEMSCTWYLVQRSAAITEVNSSNLGVTAVHKVKAGEACTVEGFYFTPAKPDSRRRFQCGEVMPAFDTKYGATIWQWDIDQTAQ